MKFNTLKERMEYFKGLTDYRLVPNSYVIAHIDGNGFSKKIKKFFKLPFDELFMEMMDESAKYACHKIQGCKIAYVQSDEISLIITDFDEDTTDSYFGFRLCKLQSIIASLVTSKFQQLFIQNMLEDRMITMARKDGKVNTNGLDDIFSDKYLFQFDCKCFVVPEYNDAFAWLKYRQNDCIRNSRQQAAQTYCSHNSLKNKTTEEQIELLWKETGIDWYSDYTDGEKYGRLVYKEELSLIGESGTEYTRNKWISHMAQPFAREFFDTLKVIPVREERYTSFAEN